MCRAISILKNRINLELFEEYDLQSRIRQRADEADEEIVFDFADRDHNPQLPVIHAGRMIICEWGNRGGRVAKLPKTGWCREESLKAGKWRWLSPEQVVIPAQLGLEKGVWFSITEGIEGIVAPKRWSFPCTRTERARRPGRCFSKPIGSRSRSASLPTSAK